MDSKIKYYVYLNSQFFYSKKLKNNLISQIGGKSINVLYNGNNYEFIKQKHNNFDEYVLYSNDNNKYNCIYILVSKEDQVAEIHGIGNYFKCFKGILPQTNTSIGSHMLKIALKLLRKNKDKLKIKKVVLKDNSLKKCNNNTIQLSKMLILLSGDSWYGKYGFKPKKNLSDDVDDQLNEFYKNNKLIMNNITIKDIDILKYIKMTNNPKLYNTIVKLLVTNDNILLKDFLNNFLRSYDIMCEQFYLFYEKLYLDIGLYNFHGVSYVLDLD